MQLMYILLVDDDRVSGVLFSRFLTRLGYPVHYVENGRLAVEDLKDRWWNGQTIDLIVVFTLSTLEIAPAPLIQHVR